MKKFLVFALVLAITSMASALIDLTISVTLDPFGTPEYIEDPVSSEIWLEPSDEMWIDIHGTVTADDPTILYLVAQGPGTMSGGVMTANAGDGGHYEYHPDDILDGEYTWGDFMADYGYPGVSPMINLLEMWDTTEPFDDMTGILLDEKLFHCDGLEDVILTLWDGDVHFGTVYDTLIIHQPEPMTIALLGLGGLFLRRRK